MMRMLGAETSASLSCQDIQSAIRILRFTAGLDPVYKWTNPANPSYVEAGATPSGNPNDVNYAPLTQQDQATLDLVDSGYLLLGFRHFTIADAIAAVRMPFGGPTEAVWSMPFIGNTLTPCGNAANSTGMPALADIDGDGTPDAAFPMGTINGTNYYPAYRFTTGPDTSHNTNAVYVLSDTTGAGGFGIESGWPKKMTDASKSVAVANIEGGSTPQVFAAGFQDSEGSGNSGLFSRLYVWNSNGTGVSNGGSGYIFPFTGDPTNTSARGQGHSAAAPVVYDLFQVGQDSGVPEIFFSSQGQTRSDPNLGSGEFGGGIQFLEPDGTIVQHTTATLTTTTPWRTGIRASQAEFIAPPALMKVYQSTDRNVVGPAYSGDIYAWSKTGQMVGSFPVHTDVITAKNVNGTPVNAGQAVVCGPIATGDVTGDGRSEVVVGSGRNTRYSTDTSFVPAGLPGAGGPQRFNDGYIYCWSDSGSLEWRYPKNNLADWNGNMNGRPAYGDAGVSVGRLLGPTSVPLIVAVDASGRVVALDGSMDDTHSDADREVWTTTLPYQPVHRYYQGVTAQPLILDLNGDGNQDVLIGTNGGYIYALDGPTEDILWTSHTFPSSDSVWRNNDATPHVDTEETQFEEIRGMGVGPMDASQTDHAILLVTAGRAGVTSPSQVGGHAMLFDLTAIPELGGTWETNSHDWPLYQHDAQRTGTYAGS